MPVLESEVQDWCCIMMLCDDDNPFLVGSTGCSHALSLIWIEIRFLLAQVVALMVLKIEAHFDFDDAQSSSSSSSSI